MICDACAHDSSNELDDQGNVRKICKLCLLTEKTNNESDDSAQYLPDEADKDNKVVMVYSASTNPNNARGADLKPKKGDNNGGL